MSIELRPMPDTPAQDADHRRYRLWISGRPWGEVRECPESEGTSRFHVVVHITDPGNYRGHGIDMGLAQGFGSSLDEALVDAIGAGRQALQSYSHGLDAFAKAFATQETSK